MGVSFKKDKPPTVETTISKLRTDLKFWSDSKQQALIDGDSYGYGYATGVCQYIQDLLGG